MRIILASSSKQRQDIFDMIGLEYDVITSDVPEKSNQILPDKYVEELSLNKAKSVRKKIDGKAIIISADTIIYCNNKIYEKPKSKEDAYLNLKKLSNNKCMAYTGITLIDLYKERIICSSSKVDIYFNKITDEEIKWYVNNEEKIFKCCGFVPLGKASLFIDKVEGDYNTMLGISPSIVYNKLKEQNVEFIFIKIAGQRQINGKIKLDPKFKTNIEEAKKHGIAVGVYFYSYARSQEEARKQARYIVKNIKNYDIELPIVFDWENWLEYNKFKLSFNSLNLIAKAFMDEVEKNGYDSLIYSSEYYLENIWFKEDYNNIWIAKYGNLEHKPSYKVWQLCSDGKIDGIDKYIDIDVMYLK